MKEVITGIQQAGIGVYDATEAKHFYKDLLGMNVLVFEDKANAVLMTAYTGNEIHSRHAILSLNMGGGGGLELWQFTSRTPQKPATIPQPGDLGIFALKIKCKDVDKAFLHYRTLKNITVSPLYKAADNCKHFWLTDQYGNIFNMVAADELFKTNSICAGVAGAIIGVSNMEKAIHFYSTVLGIKNVVYDVTGTMQDGAFSVNTNNIYRRVLLKKPAAGNGAFCKLLGGVHIELVQIKNETPQKIFTNRYWGDNGFIHLCFDVTDMDALKLHAARENYTFTVDSASSFAMGKSAGRFCYLEDPDGTLIELVETHKVPVVKKLGLYLNLKKRVAGNPLPDAVVALLGLNKIK